MSKKYISSGGRTFLDSEEKLKEYMNKTAKGFTTAIAQDAAKRLRKNTADLIYKNYSPTRYKRTMDLLNSIEGPGYNGGTATKKTMDGFEAVVGFDLDKMRLIKPTNKEWGKHVGFYGEDAREAVVYGFEEEGFVVLNKSGNIIYYREPVGMISKTIEEIENGLNSISGRVIDFDSFESKILVSINK